MYNNFNNYWEIKKEMLEKLGVRREVAEKIWQDAYDNLCFQLIYKDIKKL